MAPLPNCNSPKEAWDRGSHGPVVGSGVCPPVLHMDLAVSIRMPIRLGVMNTLRRAQACALDSDFALILEVSLFVSEFGRRLQENGSGGTDHGSASVAICYGKFIADQFLGEYPDLQKLDERGDLIPTMEPTFLYEKLLTYVLPEEIIS